MLINIPSVNSNAVFRTRFNPKRINDLTLWYDAADSAAMVLNGSRVVTWIDKSGNGLDVSHPTDSNRPDYSSSAANGRPGLMFTAARGTSLYRTSGYPNAIPSGMAAFAVVSWTTTGTAISSIQAILDNSHNGGAGFALQDRPDLTGKPLTWGIGARTITPTVTSGTGTLKVISINDVFSGSGRQIMDDNRIRIVDTTNGTASGGFYGVVNVGSTYLYARNMTGIIAEILVYRRGLTDGEFHAVREYLHQKWGIS